MFGLLSNFHKKLYNKFRRSPVTLYCIEFEKDDYKVNNIFMTRQDRTVNMFVPYYFDGFVTKTAVKQEEELIADKVHIKLEMSDLYKAGIKPVYDTTGYFTGVGDVPVFNELVDEVFTDPNFQEQPDIFVNIRTGQACRILKIGSDKVTVVLDNDLITGNPLTDIRPLDSFLILRRRSFIPHNLAHDDYEMTEASENINTNLKIENLSAVFNDIWLNTNKFDTCRVNIIYTYLDAFNINGVGPNAEGITSFDYDTFYVDTTEFNNSVMILKCIDRLQYNQNSILRRIFGKNQCPWLFGDHTCGVSNGNFEGFSRVCTGSYEECVKRDNITNFGGYINIPDNDTGGSF